MEAVLEGARRTEDAVATHLWLLDPSTATLRLVAAAGPLAPPAVPVPVDDPSLGAAVTRGAAVLVPPRTPDTGPDAHPIRYRFAVPVSAGAARGVAAVDVLAREAPDTALLISLMSQAAGLLAGSLALHVARDETRQSRLLTEASRDLTRRVDEAALVRRALDRAVELSGAATGSVMLLDPETGLMRIAAAVGLPEDVVATTAVAEGDGIAGWVLATGKPMLVEDLPGSDGGRGASSRHGVRSALSVPVVDEDGALGVINVGSRGYPARFTDQHTLSLETLAAQLAVALRNARAMRGQEDLYFGTLRGARDGAGDEGPVRPRGDGADRRDRAGARGRAGHGRAPVRGAARRRAAARHRHGGGGGGGAQRGPSAHAHRARPAHDAPGHRRRHPEGGARRSRRSRPSSYHHHERFDGTGYVGGLAGEEIPLGSRVLSLVDAYTAMTSPRPWRRAHAGRARRSGR